MRVIKYEDKYRDELYNLGVGEEWFESRSFYRKHGYK